MMVNTELAWMEDVTLRDWLYRGESTSLERGNGPCSDFLLRTSPGEESERANKFRGSFEVGKITDISAKSPSSSSSSSGSASESPDTSDVSKAWTPLLSPSAGDDDGARLYLREATSLVPEEVEEHEQTVSTALVNRSYRSIRRV